MTFYSREQSELGEFGAEPNENGAPDPEPEPAAEPDPDPKEPAAEPVSEPGG